MSRTCQPLHRRAAPSFALSILLVAGQLSLFAHLVAVQHVTCPEHGELIHVEDAQILALTPGARPEVRQAQVPANHDHDHCLLVASRRNDFLSHLAVQTFEVCSNRLVVAGVPPGRAARTGVALLLLAPKGSPPA